MRIHKLAIAIGVLSCAGGIHAQSKPALDEQQIRALIAAEETGDRPTRTADRIFWSGAYRRPTVGAERGEETPGDEGIANRVPKSERSQTTVRRIVIAKSQDLAYEFSDATLSYDLKDGRHMSVPRSVLRVWRKEEGQWKEEAYFSRAHE